MADNSKLRYYFAAVIIAAFLLLRRRPKLILGKELLWVDPLI
jgi:hypothetical protein